MHICLVYTLAIQSDEGKEKGVVLIRLVIQFFGNSEERSFRYMLDVVYNLLYACYHVYTCNKKF